jgi:acyl phosphate:glycerol-3-phosphate acyltransferase
VALTVGIRAGLAVFLIDLLKGLIAAVVAARLAGPLGAEAAALGAAVGQVAPLFASLRGGKGVATTLGGYLGLDPALALLGLAVWATGLLVLRRFVIASVTAIVANGVVAVLLGREPIFAIGAAALTLVAHRHHLAAWQRGEMPPIREALRDNRPTR